MRNDSTFQILNDLDVENMLPRTVNIIAVNEATDNYHRSMVNPFYSTINESLNVYTGMKNTIAE